MTKIKNTKKGMAKKTLSMSLVVAMLATSNVPVWAAEFSDGTDAGFTSEAPAVENSINDPIAVQTTGDAWTVTLDAALPTSVEWGNSSNITGTIVQSSTTTTSVENLKYTWKNTATGLATDTGNAVDIDNGKFSIALPKEANYVGNSYTLFMWDTTGDWTYTSDTSVTVSAKNISGLAEITVTGDIGYTGQEVKAAAEVTEKPDDFDGKFNIDYTGTPDLVNKDSKVTVTATVVGSKLYTGYVTTEYTIGQKTATADDFKLSYINTSFEYTGAEVKPAVTDIRVQDLHGQTVDGAVTSVTPKTSEGTSATAVGSYEAEAEIDMSKFPNYSGSLKTSVEEKYNIVARDLSKCTATIDAKLASTNNQAVTVNPSDVTIKDANGNTLSLSEDIEVTVPTNAVSSGTYTVTISPKSGNTNVTGSITASLTLYASDIANAIELDDVAKAELESESYYTGSQVTKDISKFTGHILKNDGTNEYLDQNQYTVEFGTNVNAGENAGIVRIVGKNTYAGSAAEYTFDITPADISKKEIADTEYKEGATNSDYAPAITLTAVNGAGQTWTLKEGTDYTVSYEIKNDKNELGGSVVATIKYSSDAQNNYSVGETETLESAIVGKTLTSDNIKLDKTSYEYTGKAIIPEFKVYDGDKLLTEGTDYVIKNTIGGKDVGEATLVITGAGNYNSKVDATVKYNVVPVSADNVTVTYTGAVYTGAAQKPELSDITVTLDGVDVKSQFTITGYGENINAGDNAGSFVLAPITGNSNFTAGTTKTATFNIAQAELKGTIKLYNANGIELTGEQTFEYDGTEKTFGKVVFTPSVTTPVTSDDYEIKYVNNITGGGDDGAYVVVIAKGNYKGTDTVVDATTNPASDIANVVAKVKFIIESKLYFTEKEITVTDAEYAGPGMTAEPTIVVRDGDKTLVKDKDYKVTLTNGGNEPGATGTYVIEGIGVYADKVDKSTNTSYKEGEWKVTKKNVANLDINVDLDANGETTLTVMNGNLKVDNKDFTVTLSDDKKTATVSATTGNQYYIGSKEVTVGGETVSVGTPIITNVKVSRNTATVVLSGEADGAVGYDYVISTDRDCITNKNYDSISKNQVKTSTSFKYVEQGVYYAYCHAWKRDENGKKVFGEWSNAYPFSVTSITPDAPVITSVKVSGSTIKVTYKAAANATGYDVVLGTSSKKENGETRPYNYGAHKKLNLKEGTVTATFKNIPAGKWTVGMHAFNRTSEDGGKVFSPWSNLKTATVK